MAKSSYYLLIYAQKKLPKVWILFIFLSETRPRNQKGNDRAAADQGPLVEVPPWETRDIQGSILEEIGPGKIYIFINIYIYFYKVTNMTCFTILPVRNYANFQKNRGSDVSFDVSRELHQLTTFSRLSSPAFSAGHSKRAGVPTKGGAQVTLHLRKSMETP